MMDPQSKAPPSRWTWLITEGRVQRDDADNVVDVELFGLVVGFESEWGYCSLAELSSIRGRYGLPIERDLSWQPTPMSKARGNQVP